MLSLFFYIIIMSFTVGGFMSHTLALSEKKVGSHIFMDPDCMDGIYINAFMEP